MRAGLKAVYDWFNENLRISRKVQTSRSYLLTYSDRSLPIQSGKYEPENTWQLYLSKDGEE
jgi:hypothetical protein